MKMYPISLREDRESHPAQALVSQSICPKMQALNAIPHLGHNVENAAGRIARISLHGAFLASKTSICVQLDLYLRHMS